MVWVTIKTVAFMSSAGDPLTPFLFVFHILCSRDGYIEWGYRQSYGFFH